MSQAPWITANDQGVEIDVLVVPRASRSELAGVQDGRLRIRLAAPPVDGKANAALIEVVAELLGVKRSAVALVSGQTGRRKRLRIQGTGLQSASRLLDPEPAGTPKSNRGR